MSDSTDMSGSKACTQDKTETAPYTNHLLVFTSIVCFGSIILHAYAIQHTLNHHTYVLLVMTSLLYHCRKDSDYVVRIGSCESKEITVPWKNGKYCKITKAVDTICAHVALVLSFFDWYALADMGHGWTILFQTIIVLLYYGEQKVTLQTGYMLHALLHVVVGIGVNTNMWLLTH